MRVPASAWQTVGPFFSLGLEARYVADLAGAAALGERITIRGRVLDGDGAAIPDALLEIWQANAYGKYAHPEDPQDKPVEGGFSGHGRVGTDGLGRFVIRTIKPGVVDAVDGIVQAPHILVSLMMRGLLRRLTTRMYFPGEPLNERDAILRLVEPERRGTLMLVPDGEVAGEFRWDIHMQGAAETVFLDF